METRLIIAAALCAAMALISIAIALRYFSNRRQFKIRQSGRGKNSANPGGLPAE
jgi:hypothetical protein